MTAHVVARELPATITTRPGAVRLLAAAEYGEQRGQHHATTHQEGHAMYAEDRACDCAGCWACAGHVKGCTCDIDWDELAERRLDAGPP